MPWFEAGDGGQVLVGVVRLCLDKKCLETNDETTRTHPRFPLHNESA